MFLPGTMSHVGRHFDLSLGDKPLRVVVVGQEAKESRVTLDQRYIDVHDRTGLERRYYADKDHKGRNPHMRGTTSALRVIFGKDPGADFEGEWVHPLRGKPFHIFDGFALVNRLLCYAGPKKGVQARPTKTMLDHCRNHLAATLSILKPTILILQGGKAASAINTILTRVTDDSGLAYEARLGRQRMVVCAFSHPAAYGDLRWGDRPDAPYLTDVVVPTLREAVRRS
ncbi:MAG: uracil-DNA glycosylase family protein [Mycobacterium sp.]